MASTWVSVVLLALVAGGLTLWGGSGVIQGYRSERWPAAEGLIEASSGSNPLKPAVDTFHLIYRYEVGATALHGTVVKLGDNGLSGTARARIYPVGRRLPVYYNPEDPSIAVLERGVGFEPTLTLAGAAALFALAVSMARESIRRPRS
jgi:hypothetical protein